MSAARPSRTRSRPKEYAWSGSYALPCAAPPRRPPGRQGVGGLVEDAGEQRRVGLPPLLVVHAAVALRRGGVVRGVARVGLDEGEQVGAARRRSSTSVEAEPVEGAQLVLVLGHLPGPERRPAGGDAAAQGCAAKSARFSSAIAVTRSRHGCPVVSVRGIRGVDGVEHEVEQLGLAGDVGVERHRRDADEPSPPGAWSPRPGLRRRRGRWRRRRPRRRSGPAAARAADGRRQAPQQAQSAGRVAGAGAVAATTSSYCPSTPYDCTVVRCTCSTRRST